jgi:hypothetical protein
VTTHCGTAPHKTVICTGHILGFDSHEKQFGFHRNVCIQSVKSYLQISIPSISVTGRFLNAGLGFYFWDVNFHFRTPTDSPGITYFEKPYMISVTKTKIRLKKLSDLGGIGSRSLF